MPKLTLTVGIPCSGKSTWAGLQYKDDENTFVVSRDSIRKMMFGLYLGSHDIENIITESVHKMITLLLTEGHNVILDNTNVRMKYINDAIKKYSPLADIHFKLFDVSLKDAKVRNIRRKVRTGKFIPEDVLERMHDALTHTKEVFDFEPIKRTISSYNGVYEEDRSLPECIIVDIDGTLAHRTDRSPYDWHRVGEDYLDRSVADIVGVLSRHYKIIVFTGRDGVCLEESKEWLRKHNIHFDEVYSRPEGNNEKDYIIKKRLFEDHIRGKYYCTAVIDDRKQVVDMWRNELGLKCLQVEDHNF